MTWALTSIRPIKCFYCSLSHFSPHHCKGFHFITFHGLYFLFHWLFHSTELNILVFVLFSNYKKVTGISEIPPPGSSPSPVSPPLILLYSILACMFTLSLFYLERRLFTCLMFKSLSAWRFASRPPTHYLKPLIKPPVMQLHFFCSLLLT